MLLADRDGVAAPAFPAPDASVPEDNLFASPTTRDHIGRIVVPVMLDGKGPFRFVVDTGASHCTASPQLAQALGLKPELTVMVDGVTGSAEVPAVRVGSLQAGALVIRDMLLPVVWAPVMAGADGILGAAGLDRHNLFVDFQRNRVSLSKAGTFGQRPGYVRLHGEHVAGGLIALDALVDGVRVRAIIDTGAERTLGNEALHAALETRLRNRARRDTRVFGATPEVVTGDLQVTPNVVLDTARLEDVQIIYGAFHIFKVWRLEKVPALIIGMDVLGTVDSLDIDFQHADVFVIGPGARDTGATPVRSLVSGRWHR